MSGTLTLKIFSYNILEDKLANVEFFINSSHDNLNKNNRTKKLINLLNNEINDNTNINIFCLQEVGTDVQLSQLYKLFYQHNYNVVYVGDVLISYPNRFKLISCESGSISKLLHNFKNKFSDKQANLINSKCKYFIILKLMDKTTNKEFIIANTHLIALDKYLKVLQLILILNVLENYNNVIFAGDLNIESHNKTLELITKGYLNNELGVYKLQKNYKSAYSVYNNLITIHTSNRITPIFTEMLDYIFVSQNINVLDCLKLKKKNELKNTEYWPSDKEASDHTLIWAIVQF
jgi:endonuclease/exonuclease/phosphatase family metal-dependent hydrolase